MKCEFEFDSGSCKHIIVWPKPKDFIMLKDNTRPIIQEQQPQNYKGFITKKPWGYEFLFFENIDIAIWLLHIEEDQMTSFHCHKNKFTTLIVLDGEIICTTTGAKYKFTKGDSIRIGEKTFHSSQAISYGGANIIEIESPVDKLDLIRAVDSYGRADKGYEGLASMETDVELNRRYNYFYIEKNDVPYVWINNITFQISANLDSIDFGNRNVICCVCKGEIAFKSRRIRAGERIKIYDNERIIETSDDLEVLVITLYGR